MDAAPYLFYFRIFSKQNSLTFSGAVNTFSLLAYASNKSKAVIDLFC